MKEIALGRDLYEYIVTRFAPEERMLLARMIRRAQVAGLPEIQISEEQAKFVRLLVRVHGATAALDVGTLFGYSAAVLARAMGASGRVVSLELEERNASVADANLKELGLDESVEIKVGPALESMRALAARSFDVVLIDADKGNYVNYIEEAARLLKPDGLVLVDNAFAFGRVLEKTNDEDVRAVQRANDHLARHQHFESVIVPIGDGLAIGRLTRRAGGNAGTS